MVAAGQNSTPNLSEHGAELHRQAATAIVDELLELLPPIPSNSGGLRLQDVDGLTQHLLPAGVIGAVAAEVLSELAQPVRALFFDKTPENNWSLAWHQDRTICVRSQHDVPGYGPWTRKGGLLHVAPPYQLLQRMVTLRVHLDDVDEDNAPLKVALKSHDLGVISAHEIDGVTRDCEEYRCYARAGDIWAYATPILHASSSAKSPGHRRVVQIDYSADQLPKPLQWLGV